ncbi:MAG: hypothetical protein INR66_01145 [Gordonia polyisoprenivorans]|nr:hypothetical protein [Gordonia polyisoprenivorans]
MTAASEQPVDHVPRVVDADRRSFLVRLLDQGLWSAGFFLVNATAAFTMTAADFAALSIATAIAFIAVAVMRSWGVYSFVVVSGRRHRPAAAFVDGHAAWRGAFVCATVGAVVTGAWLSERASTGLALLFALLGALIVVSDLPRQLLIAVGAHTRTLPLSSVYLVGGVVTTVAFLLPVGATFTVVAWLLMLVLVTIVGLVLGPRGRARERDPVEHKRVAWRLSAEALYLSIAGQAGLLLLFALHDPTSTAGLRFAYSLVFAPAFVLLQGLQPLMVRQAASAAALGARRSVRLATEWCLGQATLLAAVGGVIGVALWLFADAAGPRAALPFIVPLGVSIVSAQVFETALMAARFYLDPEVVHRTRLVVVLLDVGSQALGIVIGGPVGLAVALVVFGLARLLLSSAGLVLLRRIDTDVVTTGSPA